ncbi:hypothetical protein BDV38DRAFT_294149 [Aspergillus pseudotamarii]|uniref:Uncharacterized protein n=1 Tax=Aspergillus pseudotamarii TaxID=132259 RepID=A0A5N6SNF1_ASPPS|nr:uncharacterized protein BDV38DRAFT_294149 [Aspergillus pseudotamarii]KAE8136105.1 hypothetical protein BDV38DRAFT_294149 [Aspergillus pseudotamarii]
MSQVQGWTLGPQTRGTLDILWTCLATLGLCVWTAIHPNIPVVHNAWSTLFERLGLMGLAIIFPEIIITSAWGQRRRAKNLLVEVNRSLGRTTKKTTSEPPTTDPWFHDQAMFAVMGGFAIETHYLDSATEKRIIRRLLTPEGVSILAKTGHLPALSREDVAERSKADIFAKSIVVGQIIWFALQVLGRLCQGLPVTPLETHTAIHVGCAIIVYAIWVNKPYNLLQSVVVAGPDTNYLGAFFNFSDISRDLFQKECERYEMERIEYWKERVIQASQGVLTFGAPPKPPVLKPIDQLLDDYQSDAIRNCTKRYNDEQILCAIAEDACQGLHLLESQGCNTFRGIQPSHRKLLRHTSENFTIRTVWGGWSTDFGHEPNLEKGIHVLFNILYGGCHLAGWASDFPTALESWLWRGSALFLTTVPVWGGLWILWWKSVRSRSKALYLIRNGDLDIIAAPVFFLVLVGYTLARCYFLIEALMSLRLLPSAAYQTVQWSNFLPHVS